MSSSSEDVLEDLSTASEDNNDCYSHWAVRGIKRWKPHSLPGSLNIDGKHVWEPPVFAYNELIADEYEKKREAVLRYTKDDRAKATKILDIDVEDDLLCIYHMWLQDNLEDAKKAGDFGRASFFGGLFVDMYIAHGEVYHEHTKLGVSIKQERNKDGTWEIKDWPEDWSDVEQSASGSSLGGDDDVTEDKSDTDCPAISDNPRISTAATDAEELSWLSAIDLEAYPPLQSEQEADNEESLASFDSNIYEDARSTLSENEEET